MSQKHLDQRPQLVII